MASYFDRKEIKQAATPDTTLEILARFTNPVECLSAHLLYESSEVVAGIKPANLVSLVNRTRNCGRNLYKLWLAHQHAIHSKFQKLEFLELNRKEGSVLLLCFDRQQLEQKLSHSGLRTLLIKAGYSKDASLDELLQELTVRIRANQQFPHEIGLFIGYPAKDVAAFMGLVKLPFTCQALWKIYGKPDKSLNLARRFKQSRQKMSELLGNTEQKQLTNLMAEKMLFQSEY